MSHLIDLAKLLPRPVLIAIVGIALGIGGVFAADARYVQASTFEKNYILNLRSYIRQRQEDLKQAKSDGERVEIQKDIDAAIDELCDARPKDRLCTR